MIVDRLKRFGRELDAHFRELGAGCHDVVKVLLSDFVLGFSQFVERLASKESLEGLGVALGRLLADGCDLFEDLLSTFTKSGSMLWGN